ncbi:MAG: DUF1272 domain-containing protein [Haloarculaceae archaeon]
MGIFRDIGRRVEEFKQTAEETAAETAAYECRDCGERFHADHDACPECGGTVAERPSEE